MLCSRDTSPPYRMPLFPIPAADIMIITNSHHM